MNFKTYSTMSIKDKITPGPWGIFTMDTALDKWHIIEKTTGYEVGAITKDHVVNGEFAQREANVKLMAASPEMLDILERLSKAETRWDGEQEHALEFEDIQRLAINLLKQLNNE